MKLLQYAFAAIGGWIGWYLGGWDISIKILILFITIDYGTGVVCAINDKSLSSETGYRGIFKKVFMLILVGIGATIDRYILQTGEILRTALIFYYLSNEGISILENATRLGVPFPEKLKTVLAQLKEDNDDN